MNSAAPACMFSAVSEKLNEVFVIGVKIRTESGKSQAIFTFTIPFSVEISESASIA